MVGAGDNLSTVIATLVLSSVLGRHPDPGGLHPLRRRGPWPHSLLCFVGRREWARVLIMRRA